MNLGVTNSMKYFFLVLTLCNFLPVLAQSVQETHTQPQIKNSAEEKVQLLASLKKKGLQNPANADAWLALYQQTARDKNINTQTKENELSFLTHAATSFIKESWQYQLILFLQSGKKEKEDVFKALELSKDKVAIYPYIVQYSIIANDKMMLAEYAQKLYAASPLSANLYEYHYNTLMSANSNAIIYARGIGDLVALAMVQQATNIRKDITLKYYEEGLPFEPNAYLCLSIGKEEIAKFPDAYYTGLLVSLNPAGDFTELSNHISNDFKKERLDKAENLTEQEKQLYKNYLPSFLLLYKSYENKNTAQAKWLLQKMEFIARQAGISEELYKQLK